MITFILAVLCLILTVTLVFAVRRINDMQQDECFEVDADHTKCIAAVMQVVGDQFAAKVLEAAAADYDSVEEIGHMKILARLKYQAGGPSMPKIWLLDRAATLRGEKIGGEG